MTVALTSQPLAEDWKDDLGLNARRSPELYSDAAAVGDVPHAGPIRTALRDFGADSVFCIQDVPTAVFFAAEDAEPENIAPLHSNLWNQGLATVLAVVCRDTIRIYSLAAVPPDRQRHRLDDHCLVEMLHKVEHAIKVRSLISGMESGRYWREHKKWFNPEQRVDGALLGNLKESDSRLQQFELPPEASQAILMQTMFIAYLEDRSVIGTNYIKDATDRKFATFGDILEAQEVTAFYALFRSLNQDFNGDLFVKPCSFGSAGPRLLRKHLPTLARFRAGMYEMGPHADQGRLWAYDFKFIPVELISAVYDRFLSTEDRASKGQFHTPMHLANSVVSQLWDDPQFLTQRAKTHGTILDPACGSGIFLACLFKRLCEQWRQNNGTKKIRWHRLRDILHQLTGFDIDASAVRVAIFSLYIALLEEVDPPDIRKLMARGRLLPRLWGFTLRNANFFDVETSTQYDIVIGNPPWRSGDGHATSWCAEHRLPVPDKQAAWGFVWKAVRHLKKDGKIALLLPAKPFLHNHAQYAVSARDQLLGELRAERIVNYADLRLQLFGNAVQPATLFIGGKNHGGEPYWFHYWVPKTDPSLGAAGVLTTNELDKKRLDTIELVKDPLLFKKRLWMTGPEDKLFRYLDRYTPLRDTVKLYGDVRWQGAAPDDWVIGQGLKPANPDRVDDPTYDTVDDSIAGDILAMPFMPSGAFRIFSPNTHALVPFTHAKLHRSGFPRGFKGPRVLVPQGAGPERLRAAYTETAFTFRHAIQAIVVPESDAFRAKLLAALLNSKLIFWFAFHASSSIGSERPAVHESELLNLPFPDPGDTPEPDRAHLAASKAVALMDEATRRLDATMQPSDLLGRKAEIVVRKSIQELLGHLDALVYDYFCLSTEEIMVVEDTIEFVVPAVQPRSTVRNLKIWERTNHTRRRAYADVLIKALADWMEPERCVAVALVACNEDCAVVRLRLCLKEDSVEYAEPLGDVGAALTRVANAATEVLPGNLQQVPNLRVYDGDDLYLVKPNKLRFWTRSAALADAEEIVVDLWH